MVVNYDRLFTSRSKSLKSSEIRELLKLTQSAGFISLAGGLPNPQAFPVDVIHECIEKVFKTNIHNALQYGTTEGLPLLRDVLAKRMKEKKGIDCELHDILITNGAQQALSFIAYNFLEQGDTYITSAPTYLGALQAFHAYQGNCECIPMNDEGIDIDSLRRNLKRLHRTGITPKFLYAVATFQNPSGESISLEHRKELLEIASEYDFLIIEDDPYGELVFEGKPIPPIKSLDTKGRVVYIGTFSKVLAPGFRLAWVVASEEIINKFALTKQSSDLCSNMFVQYVAYEYVKGGYLDKQIQHIKTLYHHKRDVMIKALKEYFPKEAKWNVPGGGMFLWVTLPKNINTRLMFKRALAKKVAYVVGDAFYPDSSNYNSMRLNFSYSEDEVILEGIKRLADVIKEEMTTSYYDKDYYVNGV
ncbi:MAG: PLP-dependent aminotransferase family protein [Candidatus Thermoplasmatota archaeon]|nr:PLP-dependent aminotransferase family protein [Candidatus Thermoplasmatota archaeon]